MTTPKVIKVFSPLAVFLPRKTIKDKKYILNLNNYRNWHYIVSNKLKDAYTRHMASQLKGLKFDKICLIFKYFKGSKRKCDRANIYSIQEKFFCDALVFHKVIKDDSDMFIKHTYCLTVEYDKLNPRVEIIIINSPTLPTHYGNENYFGTWKNNVLC